MPRPTAAPVAYGALTVALSALAVLLLSGTTSGPAWGSSPSPRSVSECWWR